MLDSNARIDERDDAAMDLADYNEPEAESALVRVCGEFGLDETILDSAGESLAEIWLRKSEFQPEVFKNLPRAAKKAAEAIIKSQRPDWLLQ